MDNMDIDLILWVVVFTVLWLSPAKEWLQHWFPYPWPRDREPATPSSQRQAQDEAMALLKQPAAVKVAMDQQNIQLSHAGVAMGQVHAQLAA